MATRLEGSASRQADRDGPAGLAEPHRGRAPGAPSPFVEGVLSVDPTAENLGVLDASAGQEAAKQIIVDLLTQRPEVNLIYSEASNLTVGTMAGLSQLGRGMFEDGKPADRDRGQRGLRHGRVRAGLRPELQPEGCPWACRPSRRRRVASTSSWTSRRQTVAQQLGPRRGEVLQGLHRSPSGACRRTEAQTVAGRPVRRRSAGRLAGGTVGGGRDPGPDAPGPTPQRPRVRGGQRPVLRPDAPRTSRQGWTRSGAVARPWLKKSARPASRQPCPVRPATSPGTFPGVRAVDDVTFAIDAEHVHCLVGENGAGKSTLVKMLTGALQPTSGDDDRARRALSARATRMLPEPGGIATLFQELHVVDELTRPGEPDAGHGADAASGSWSRSDLDDRVVQTLAAIEPVHRSRRRRVVVAERRAEADRRDRSRRVLRGQRHHHG